MQTGPIYNPQVGDTVSDRLDESIVGRIVKRVDSELVIELDGGRIINRRVSAVEYRPSPEETDQLLAQFRATWTKRIEKKRNQHPPPEAGPHSWPGMSLDDSQ